MSLRRLLFARVKVTPTAASPAATSASSSPTLVGMRKERLLNHILGCRHWLIEQALLLLTLSTSAPLGFLVGVEAVFLGDWFYFEPYEVLFIFLH